MLVAALVLAACGGDRRAAAPPAGPRLSRVCLGQVPHGLRAETSWLRASDGLRLFAFTSGSGSTGVVLAHESPGGACTSTPPTQRRLIRAAGSADKQLALYPGSYHGWDLLERAPFRERVRSRLLGWIRDR